MARYNNVPFDQIPHGGSGNGYNNYGCRCPECTAANTENQRRRREKRGGRGVVPPGVQHGKYTTYVNYGCRCKACRLAGRIRYRVIAKRRAAAE